MKSGGDKGKTNNVMEMTAVLQAMKSITNKSIPAEVFSDSKYVVETLNGNFQIKKILSYGGNLWRRNRSLQTLSLSGLRVTTRTGIILRLIKWRL